jgi:hypothetical protein
MPVPDVIAASNGHQWHIRFDRVVCRDCDAVRGEDDGKRCKGATKIRPMAGMRNGGAELGLNITRVVISIRENESLSVT